MDNHSTDNCGYDDNKKRETLMFYFVLIILVLILFFMTRKDRRSSDKYVTGALASFTVSIVALVSYIAKDAYYNNVVNMYFFLPKKVWSMFMFSSVPRSWSIRCLNLSSLLVLWFFVHFALTFLADSRMERNKKIQRLLLTYLVLQLVFYDPAFQTAVYCLLYPKYLEVHAIRCIATWCHIVTCFGNMMLLTTAIGRVIWSSCKKSSAYFFRYYAWGEAICFSCIAIAYLFIFWFAPMGLVRVSRVTNTISYKSVPLPWNNIIYRIYPYYLVATTLVIMYFLWESISNRKKLEGHELNIKRQIDAADTTSKIFCHYMKNEILALQAEVEMLDVATGEGEAEKNAIVDRCEHLYMRLDEIHRATKRQELVLKRTDIREVLDGILEHMAPDLRNCAVEKTYEGMIPDVLLDSNYFEQAVHNIIVNAIEAMEKEQGRDNRLAVRVESLDNWIQISIADNGVGISEGNLQNIFTPFYSSAPIKQHWGIGLGLTHKIIAAHGGRIEVESCEHGGTTFRIILPSILLAEQ